MNKEVTMYVKKWGAALLTLCMLLTLLPATALAATDPAPESQESSEYRFLLNDGNELLYAEYDPDELLVLAKDAAKTFYLYLVEVQPDGTMTAVSSDRYQPTVNGGSHAQWTATARQDKQGYTLTAQNLQVTVPAEADTLNISLADTSDFGTVASVQWRVHVVDKAPNLRNGVELTAVRDSSEPVVPGKPFDVTLTIANSTAEDIRLTGCRLYASGFEGENALGTSTIPSFEDGDVLAAGETMVIHGTMDPFRAPENCGKNGSQEDYEIWLLSPRSLPYSYQYKTLRVAFAPDDQKIDMKISLTPTNKISDMTYPDLPEKFYLGEESYDIQFSVTNHFERSIYLVNQIGLYKENDLIMPETMIPVERVDSHNMEWVEDTHYGVAWYQRNSSLAAGESMSFTVRIPMANVKAVVSAGDRLLFLPHILEILGPDESMLLSHDAGYPDTWTMEAVEGTHPQTKVTYDPLTSVPEALKQFADTLEKLQNLLLPKQDGYTAEQSALYDVELMARPNDKAEWTPVTADKFPAEGLEVTLPYPEGVDPATHDFKVSHMFDENANGHQIGDIETPAVTEQKDGLHFMLTGTSPVLVSWHSHSFAPEWTSDEANHWHVCACGEISDKAAHTWDAGDVTEEPTTSATGKKVYTCTVCGAEKAEILDRLPSGGPGGGGISKPAVRPVPPQKPEEPMVPQLSFQDVNREDYFYDSVQWAVKNEIANGLDGGVFAPGRSCTRAQMVTFLWRSAGSPAPDAEALPFADVASDAYYAQAVLWAVEQGITKGVTETTFAPNDTVTRAQAVTFLWRSAGTPAADSADFADVPADAYYAEAVAWANSQNITKGVKETQFQPDADCTRGQIVTFLYRHIGQ